MKVYAHWPMTGQAKKRIHMMVALMAGLLCSGPLWV
jgi:hypothetical protein